MTESDRRDFLKKAAAAAAVGVSGARAAGAIPAEETADEESTARHAAAGRALQTPATPAETLRAVGRAVLPTAELGNDGIERVVTEFEAWIEGFEPVAERPHGYLHRGLAEIRYGPPHPGPRWAAQIEALELQAERRYRASFAVLPIEQQRSLIERQLERDEIGRLPSAGQARHVAIGLLAFFYDRPEATDLCYRASIGRYRCRGLRNIGQRPRPLPGTARQPSPGDEPRRRASADREDGSTSVARAERTEWTNDSQ